MGGAQRLRISSQSLKRAWRTSDVFVSALKDHLGIRTKRLGSEVFEQLSVEGVPRDKAKKWARAIAGVFGGLEGEDLEIKQLAHIAPEERDSVNHLVAVLAGQNRGPNDAELDLLREKSTAADIALFGRMLASKPKFNVEGAAQVAHAITVHKVAVEDDYFTAVDDLNRGEENLGAGYIGETEFAAGVFYLYVCLDRELLKQNLSDDSRTVIQAIKALVEAAATVAPTGKQNSFGSRAYASYILAEKGERQPRSLSVAFLTPIEGADILATAIQRLEDTREKMRLVYDDTQRAEQHFVLNAKQGVGKLSELTAFATMP